MRISSRLTLAWALVSLVASVLVGLFVNYAVEARWVAPLAMGAVLGLMLMYGRIPARGRDEDDDDED